MLHFTSFICITERPAGVAIKIEFRSTCGFLHKQMLSIERN